MPPRSELSRRLEATILADLRSRPTGTFATAGDLARRIPAAYDDVYRELRRLEDHRLVIRHDDHAAWALTDRGALHRPTGTAGADIIDLTAARALYRRR